MGDTQGTFSSWPHKPPIKVFVKQSHKTITLQCRETQGRKLWEEFFSGRQEQLPRGCVLWERAVAEHTAGCEGTSAVSDESLCWLASCHTWGFVSLSSCDSPALLLPTWQSLGMGTAQGLVLSWSCKCWSREACAAPKAQKYQGLLKVPE